jgi:hypothetical protein
MLACVAGPWLCGCEQAIEMEGDRVENGWLLYYWGYGPRMRALERATRLILVRVDHSQMTSRGSVLSPAGEYYVTVNDLAYPVGTAGNLTLIDVRLKIRLSIANVRDEELSRFYRRLDAVLPRIPSALRNLARATGDERARAMAEAMISDEPEKPGWFKSRGIQIIEARSRKEVEHEWPRRAHTQG